MFLVFILNENNIYKVVSIIKHMKILVDMDGVIADFERGVLDTYQLLYPDKYYIPLEKRTVFKVKEQYPKNLQKLVEDIYLAPGFFRSLFPIEGGLDALLEMQTKGHEVFICTSPLSKYQHCVLEKFEWVDSYLGKEWVEKIILAKDKTLIRGDLLIDDKPEVKGVETPLWEHILYSQPYNNSTANKRRLTWQNWHQVLCV